VVVVVVVVVMKVNGKRLQKRFISEPITIKAVLASPGVKKGNSIIKNYKT
jgi:hypothetical protein